MYFLVFDYADGTTGKLGPIVSDDPSKGFDDRKIYYKATKWANELNRLFKDVTCHVEVDNDSD